MLMKYLEYVYLYVLPIKLLPVNLQTYSKGQRRIYLSQIHNLCFKYNQTIVSLFFRVFVQGAVLRFGVQLEEPFPARFVSLR